MKPVEFMNFLLIPNLLLIEEWTSIPLTDQSLVATMSIAGQESAWQHRRQIGIGQYHPQSVGARGYWQCESTWGGPVAINDVMQKCPQQLAAVCARLEIPGDELTLYEAIAWNDTLACAIARLLLWADPRPLPAVGDRAGMWQYYLDNWRPGTPHPGTWPDRYATAVSLLGEQADLVPALRVARAAARPGSGVA